MFLKVNRSKGHEYLFLVQSYREKSKNKHRVIASLGKLSDFSDSSFISISNKLMQLAGVSRIPTNVRNSEIIKTYNWGASAVVRKLWENLDLDYILSEAFEGSRVKFDANEAVFNIVLNRLTHPESKLKLHSRQEDVVGICKMDLHHYYKVLDVLANNKEVVEELMFKHSNKPFSKTVDIVLYDVTTLYFESTSCDELKKKGWSKDGKSREVQVVVGLAADKEGRPISFDVFPGNKYEGHTLLSALEKLKSRFDIDKVVIVADRGINNEENLDKIREAGYDYVFGHRFKTAEKMLKKSILDVKNYASIDVDIDGNTCSSVKDICLNEKGGIIPLSSEEKTKDRVICSWSAARAAKDKKEREKNIEKARYLVANPHKLEDKRGCKKYVTITLEEENTNNFKLDKFKERAKKIVKSVELNVEQIIKDSMYDGIYTIQTSNTTLTAKEVLIAYKHLWKIEESFRVLKTSLETRPIYHWTPSRVVGHLMCCYIALIVERALENILTKKGIGYSVDRIREAINKLNVSKVKLADGEPEIYLHQSLNSSEFELSKKILKTLGIGIPKSCMTEEQFKIAYQK